jgi:chromosome segregation ATPase
MANKKTNNNVDVKYGYYSKLLKEPFDTIEELQEAEEAYYAKQKAKEAAAATKKADAQKVDEAFKALNAARKEYKEALTQLTEEYAESLEHLKKAFELGKKDIHDTLAAAEDAYETALKEFTDKYPEGYHLTLKDGDFETTISKKTFENNPAKKAVDIFDLFFGW